MPSLINRYGHYIASLVIAFLQVTLEEQMICGALQTLNEEAFEDVISNDRGGGSGNNSTGETLGQQLAPIRESFEFNTPSDNLNVIMISGGNGDVAGVEVTPPSAPTITASTTPTTATNPTVIDTDETVITMSSGAATNYNTTFSVISGSNRNINNATAESYNNNRNQHAASNAINSYYGSRMPPPIYGFFTENTLHIDENNGVVPTVVVMTGSSSSFEPSAPPFTQNIDDTLL